MLQSHVPERTIASWATYDVASRAAAGLLILLVSLFWLLPRLSGERVTEILTLRLGYTQDLPVAWLFLLCFVLRPRPVQEQTSRQFKTTVPAVALCALAIFLIGWLGTYVVFHGYLLSRDEQVAVIDQQIFAHGRLFWPIAIEWRPFADALNHGFLLPIGGDEFWVSAYLPMHSGFRALMETIGAADLSSPIMAALSAVGLWAVARRLWPDSNRTVLLALVLLASSSQVLVTSMTAFAMNMHLALNMVWLGLFLADRPKTHVAAAAVGFCATGVHQPFFHPLFALPFFVVLVEQRRWRLLAFYGAAYAATGLFWLEWPRWIMSHGTSASSVSACASAVCDGGASSLERMHENFSTFGLQKVWITAADLLRFVCWQHPMMVPLAVFGAISCWHEEPLVRALAYGFMIPVIVIGVVLAWQGYGWGYRYVHPVLGNAILLACYGYRRIETAGLSIKRPLLITTAVAIFLFPLHAWMVARFAAPFREAHDQIVTTRASTVIVDTALVPFGQDLVVNRFDLSNRPKLMMATFLKPEDMAALCRQSTIAFFDSRRMGPISALFEVPAPDKPSRRMTKLMQAAKGARCDIVGTSR